MHRQLPSSSRSARTVSKTQPSRASGISPAPVEALEALGASERSNRATRLEEQIAANNAALLQQPYFQRCRAGQIGQRHLLEIVKQLYCFSVFFERVLARRVAEYTSMRDPRVIALARSHIREEVGHAQMFRDCLLANGISSREIEAETPRTFTKAVFGYLTVTVQYESEYVTNVAIMQVMESVGFHFFSATLETMRAHGMFAEALAQHAEDDEEHSLLGLDLVEDFDDETMQSCERVVDDLYRLMGLMFEEWLGMGGLAPLRRAETLATQDSPSASLPA